MVEHIGHWTIVIIVDLLNHFRLDCNYYFLQCYLLNYSINLHNQELDRYMVVITKNRPGSSMG